MKALPMTDDEVNALRNATIEECAQVVDVLSASCKGDMKDALVIAASTIRAMKE